MLLLTCAGLAVSAFIVVTLALSPGRGVRERRFLSIVCAQAALLFFKDVVDKSGGPRALTTFLIFVNFLFGLPAAYLFLRQSLGQPAHRPLLYFIPAIANIPAAAVIARRAIGSEGVDSAMAYGAGLGSYLPLIYLNALAAGETIQLFAYSSAGVRRIARGTEERRRERLVVTGVIIGCFGVYHVVRWAGLAIRVLAARGAGLARLPGWVNASSLAFVALVVVLGGIYVITRTDIMGRGNAKARARYGGKPMNDGEGERIAVRAVELLSKSDDLSPESVTPRRLAARLQIPYYLLSRAVNELRGQTVADLIREMRIERAKLLLDTRPGDSILQIALESGFTAKSSFNAAFRRTAGMSPGEYRRRASAPTRSRARSR